jgi:hypothetical protein
MENGWHIVVPMNKRLYNNGTNFIYYDYVFVVSCYKNFYEQRFWKFGGCNGGRANFK